MLDKLGSLMANFNPGNVQAPGAPVLPQQNWMGKMKDTLTPGGGLEQLVVALDLFGRGLDKRAGGEGTGFGGAEMAQSSLANRAATQRQNQWNQILSQLIGGMTPGTSPGGNAVKITPNEDGTHKLTYDHTLGPEGAGAEGLEPLTKNLSSPGGFMGNRMENFPFY